MLAFPQPPVEKFTPDWYTSGNQKKCKKSEPKSTFSCTFRYTFMIHYFHFWALSFSVVSKICIKVKMKISIRMKIAAQSNKTNCKTNINNLIMLWRISLGLQVFFWRRISRIAWIQIGLSKHSSQRQINKNY